MPDIYDRPSVRFCRIDAANAERVADFILWLCYRNSAPKSGHYPMEDDERSDPEKQIEDYWFFDAPRHRMAKLPWQQLQRNRSEEYFDQRFRFDGTTLAKDCSDCGSVLTPIQTRLRTVIQACSDRKRQDEKIGQGAWGEALWLPTEHSDYVRRKIRRARLDLIEHEADYPSATKFNVNYFFVHKVRAIQVPTTDVDRIYRGYRHVESRQIFNVVEIEAGGKFYPLTNAREPASSPGYNFTWGYGGGGPYSLAISILADATNGDIEVAFAVGSAVYGGPAD